MLGLSLALAAGFCAALASSFAKFAMSPELLRNVICDNVFIYSIIGATRNGRHCQWVVMFFRVFFFSLVFVFNALMWTLFVKSLRKCSSTAVATVTNTGSNLVCTAILGIVFFGETQTMKWWIGASMIIMGLVLIHHSNKSKRMDDAVDKTKDE
ncbi:hypothetical protein QZH41_017188 [Actinostola sp. cb2023]|nr:hypothetical protein QZH41_017188 [Actinostola sp. cb2023]